MDPTEDRPERDAQATAGPSGTDAQPTGGFTKRKNRGNLRKRPADDLQDKEGENSLFFIVMCGSSIQWLSQILPVIITIVLHYAELQK